MISEEPEGRKIGSGRSEESLQRLGATQLGWGSEALMATAGLLPGPSWYLPTQSVQSGTPFPGQAPAPGLSLHASACKAGTNSFWALLGSADWPVGGIVTMPY